MTRTTDKRVRLERRMTLSSTWLDRKHGPLESSEYLLHVSPDGTERRFSDPLSVPKQMQVMRVMVEGRFEKTCTSNGERFEGAAMIVFPVSPYGDRWAVDDASHDKRTLWKREII
ncbi:MAG: hypothetical protein ABL973_11275 [Micropepsaceae bacterium]